VNFVIWKHRERPAHNTFQNGESIMAEELSAAAAETRETRQRLRASLSTKRCRLLDSYLCVRLCVCACVCV
jgi:hypothetical protein